MWLVAGALFWHLDEERGALATWLLGSLVAGGAALLWIGAFDLSSWRMRQADLSAVEQIAAGDLQMPGYLRTDMGESARSVHALNRMAERLQRQSRKRSRERDRLDTVLQVMNDGVIMLNKHGYVSILNPAAAQILNVKLDDALDKSFVQVVKDYRVADVWLACVEHNLEHSATLELTSDVYIRVIVTPFLRGDANGFLVLLQDLSHLHRLETIRRDFVSNLCARAAHASGLAQGVGRYTARWRPRNSPAATHFLERMEIEVDEMTQMVQELLELSRIESGQVPLRLFPTKIAALVEPIMERLRPQAAASPVDTPTLFGEQTARGPGGYRPYTHGPAQPAPQRHQIYSGTGNHHCAGSSLCRACPVSTPTSL
jgi:two-component system phosphate regulon sensor histidine kinase PhoR